MSKVASLGEIKERWTLLDLVDAHLCLDLQEDVDRFVYARSRR